MRRFVLSSLALSFLALCSASINAQTPGLPRYLGTSFSSYNQFREDHKLQMAHVVSTRGGKLGPNEKTKVEVTSVQNRSASKTITAVKFQWFLFNYLDLDSALATGASEIVSVRIEPNKVEKFVSLVLNLEDISYLQSKPIGTFALEIGVAEIRYEDGSVWMGSGQPGKMDPEVKAKATQFNSGRPLQ